jgi:hypothetical protein
VSQQAAFDRDGDAPEDEADVEDVGADDIGDGDVALALEAGGERHGRLGGAGAERDDREPDDEIGDAEVAGDARGRVHQPIGARSDDVDDPEDQQDLGHEEEPAGDPGLGDAGQGCAGDQQAQREALEVVAQSDLRVEEGWGTASTWT